MIDREKQPLLGQVGKQANQIVAAAADFGMLAFGQVIDADVDLRPAGHPAGDLFADKEIRMPPQLFGASDGVVVGQRDQVHAALSQRGVDLGRRAVTLQEKMTQDRHGHMFRNETSGRASRISSWEMVSNEVC